MNKEETPIAVVSVMTDYAHQEEFRVMAASPLPTIDSPSPSSNDDLFIIQALLAVVEHRGSWLGFQFTALRDLRWAIEDEIGSLSAGDLPDDGELAAYRD